MLPAPEEIAPGELQQFGFSVDGGLPGMEPLVPGTYEFTRPIPFTVKGSEQKNSVRSTLTLRVERA